MKGRWQLFRGAHTGASRQLFDKVDAENAPEFLLIEVAHPRAPTGYGPAPQDAIRAFTGNCRRQQGLLRVQERQLDGVRNDEGCRIARPSPRQRDEALETLPRSQNSDYIL